MKFKQDRMNVVYDIEKLRRLFGDDLDWLLHLCKDHDITIYSPSDTDGLSYENTDDLCSRFLSQLEGGPFLIEL